MRVKIKFDAPFIFYTDIPVRISDINYGGHVGNDRILSIIHEARLQMLAQWQFTELDAGGFGLIMADSAIQYKAEAFYGDILTVAISVENIRSVSFDLLYRLTTQRSSLTCDIAFAKTGMVSFDYQDRRIVDIPARLAEKLS